MCIRDRFSGVENVTLDLSKTEQIKVVLEEEYMKDILEFIFSHDNSDHGQHPKHSISLLEKSS